MNGFFILYAGFIFIFSMVDKYFIICKFYCFSFCLIIIRKRYHNKLDYVGIAITLCCCHIEVFSFVII